MADTMKAVGNALAPITLGLSTLFTALPAQQLEAEARMTLARVVSEKENARVANSAAVITRDRLIPMVRNFLAGLSVCQRFFATTHSELEMMHKDAQTAVDKKEANKKMKKHYKLMGSKAKEIKTNCSNFIGSLGEVGVQFKMG
jgi:hypothetical protein